MARRLHGQEETLSCPHLTFYPDIFDEVSKGFSEEVCQKARWLLEREKAVAEAPGLFPQNARPGGSGLRASLSGTAKATNELTDVLSLYRDARFERVEGLKKARK